MVNLKIKNRESLFLFVKQINSNELGGIVQNEIPIRETDIILEFIQVDKVIDDLQEYKKRLIANLEQNY